MPLTTDTSQGESHQCQTLDTSQGERHTQTKSEEMEKDISCKRK